MSSASDAVVPLPGSSTFDPSHEWFGIEVDESHDNVPKLSLVLI